MILRPLLPALRLAATADPPPGLGLGVRLSGSPTRLCSIDEDQDGRPDPFETRNGAEASLSMDPLGIDPCLGAHSGLVENMDAAGTPEPTVEPPARWPSASPAPASSSASDPSTRRKLQWEFKGLTLWLELEEFDSDLTRALEDLSAKHSSPAIPKPHTTAIYGMEHLTVEEARARLASVRTKIPQWPAFACPTGVTTDVAVCGRPGQVCSIAWSEITLASSPEHEDALDVLYRIFYADDGDGGDGPSSPAPRRDRPWRPHNSIAYDNPETNALSLLDTAAYASAHPTLLGRGRRVEALSLWSTDGKMEEWECLDRVRFW